MDIIGIKSGMGWERREQTKKQKALERKASLMFRVMKQFGISEKYSQNTVSINRAKMNEFTLNDILEYKFDYGSTNNAHIKLK